MSSPTASDSDAEAAEKEKERLLNWQQMVTNLAADEDFIRHLLNNKEFTTALADNKNVVITLANNDALMNKLIAHISHDMKTNMLAGTGLIEDNEFCEKLAKSPVFLKQLFGERFETQVFQVVHRFIHSNHIGTLLCRRDAFQDSIKAIVAGRPLPPNSFTSPDRVDTPSTQTTSNSTGKLKRSTSFSDKMSPKAIEMILNTDSKPSATKRKISTPAEGTRSKRAKTPDQKTVKIKSETSSTKGSHVTDHKVFYVDSSEAPTSSDEDDSAQEQAKLRDAFDQICKEIKIEYKKDKKGEPNQVFTPERELECLRELYKTEKATTRRILGKKKIKLFNMVASWIESKFGITSKNDMDFVKNLVEYEARGYQPDYKSDFARTKIKTTKP